jgi:hypothetical protein
MEAADGLDLAERVGIIGIGVAEVEVVGAPCLHVAVVVLEGGEGEERVGLVVHEVAADLIRGVGEAVGMFVVGGLEENDGGVDGAGAEGDDGCFVLCGSGGVGVLDFYRGDGGSGGVGEEAEDARVGDEGDVGEMHDLANAVDVGVGFSVDEAGVAVAGVAADAPGGDGIGGVALEAEGNGEGADAEVADGGFDIGHAGFVGEGRVGVGLGVEGLGGVVAAGVAAGNRGCGAEIAVDVEELFGVGVEGLHVGVGDGPGGRDAALMLDDAEVFGAHAEHGGAVNFRLATDEVGLLGMEGLVILVVPGFGGVITVVEEDGGGVPVELLLREEGAALDDEDALACAGEMEGEGSAAGAGADDDCVEGIGHGGEMRGGVR